MLLVHEVHRVAGEKEEAFEAAFRDELMPALASADGCRLLWFLRLAHGSGPAYTVVTDHRLPRRRGVGGPGRARPRRRPGGLVGEGRRHAARAARPRS